MTKINNQSTHLPPPFEIFGNSGSVVIFGAAENGKRAQKILSDNQINIKFFVDNDAKKWGKTINDVLIVSPDYLFKESKQIPVFIASSSFNEIEKQLKQAGMENIYNIFDINDIIVFINSFMSGQIPQILFSTESNLKITPDMISAILKSHPKIYTKKIYIFGINYLARELFQTLKNHDINIKACIFDGNFKDEFAEIPIISYLDILFENIDDIFVIVTDDRVYPYFLKPMLEELGLKENINFCHLDLDPKIFADGGTLFYQDSMLHYNRNDDLLGFKIIGNKSPSKSTGIPLKILVLGGSTSDAVAFGFKSWSHFLSEKLSDNDICATIFAGGIAGYNSTQELNKLIRDGLLLNPDIVISYSGVNDALTAALLPDLKKTFLNKRPYFGIMNMHHTFTKIFLKIPYHGLQTEISNAKYWLRNMKIMHSLSQTMGFRFFSLLQPNIYAGNTFEISESLAKTMSIIFNECPEELFIKSFRLFYNEILSQISDIDYIYNLTNIFERDNYVFCDDSHVTEYGNKLIADSIFDVIIETVEELKK